MESALQQINSELIACDIYDNFTNELRVCVVNFSYYLTLVGPEEALKTYIPLLVETLHKCPYTAHRAYILISTWLKHPDINAIAVKEELGQINYVLINPSFKSPSFIGRFSRNYTLLQPIVETIMFNVVLPEERHFLLKWKLRNRETETEDLLYAKMGNTSRRIREYIFTFLDCSSLKQAEAVCRDFFTHCHSQIVYNVVYLQRFKQTHPALFKEIPEKDLESRIERFKTEVTSINSLITLVNQTIKHITVSDAATSQRDLLNIWGPLRKDMNLLRNHIETATKTFPLEMLLFQATVKTRAGS